MIPGYPFKLETESSGLHAPEFGSCEVEFAEIMYWLILANNFHSILEIGCYKGHTTWWFNEACEQQNSFLHCVDPNPLFQLKEYPALAMLHNMPSDFFFKKFTLRFDFIFIDGDHSYDQAKKDYENSLKSILRPGIIAIHDTMFHSASVGKLVKEVSAEVPGAPNVFAHWTHLPFGKGLSWVYLT